MILQRRGSEVASQKATELLFSALATADHLILNLNLVTPRDRFKGVTPSEDSQSLALGANVTLPDAS